MRKLSISKVRGPLAAFADGFRCELSHLGYPPSTAEAKVWVMARLSRWLEESDLAPEDLTPSRIEAFIRVHSAAHSKVARARSLAPLIGYLRDIGVVPPVCVQPSTALEGLIVAYRSWLVDERGLAARTVRRYEDSARRFLQVRIGAPGGECGAENLSGVDVTNYLLAECGRLAVGSAKGRVAEMRSLLRFLYLKGFIPTQLAASVPPVAGWRDTTLPPTLTQAQVTAIIESCDRATGIGLRNFAIVMVLARLGLRAAEVAGLRLSDVDWRAGEIIVHGKARRTDRLPLPADVGEALAAYLSTSRPTTSCRAVFVTRYAPLRPMASQTVSKIVFAASGRAGLSPPVGAHRLRHALATEMLARGANLVEISQVLRHRDLATTGVYAKVDIGRLRQVSRPWLGGE